MNISSLAVTNAAFRTQAPPTAYATGATQQSGRPHQPAKTSSLVTADAGQSASSATSASTANGSLLDTLI